MITYCEGYEITGRSFGIEDYRKPGEHFMPDLPHKRFRCWMTGCGIGQADTLIEARYLIYNYAVEIINDNIRDIETKLVANIAARDLLGDNSVNLGLYKLEEAIKK